ncbi:myelin-associated glycoprotein-like isoform X2 [Chrysemys picta bellii]|uniref:myelin-associated glycoprotein-like isoform X2 n=1 Tax=Chrysemys picta bellii TaxID=8478 RepID=UPI0032B2DC9B
MAGSPEAGHAVSLTWQHLLLALLEALCYSHVSGSWTSSLPGTIRALKGSCVVIPCSFTYPGSRESLGGPFNVVWYQYRSRGYPEIYNSKGTASVLAEYQARTQLLGDLEMKNCTLRISPVRSEDAMSYYVWINPDSVRHRFYDVTVRVEVADTPDPLMLSDPGVLIEGDRTTITCSIRHTCPSAPPSLGWSPGGGKAATSHKRLAEGGWRAESELSYTPSYKDHGRYLRCTATFPNQQQARNGLYLQVKYRPRGTAVAVVGPARLKEGDNVTLRCTSQSHPPATTYRWFQGPRRALLQGLGRGPEVTVLAVGRLSGPYRCAAENEIGRGEDSPAANLDVEYPPELLPQGNCTVRGSRLGGAIMCHCAAEGNPPPRLEWRLPKRTLPGDFEGPELRATSEVRGPAVSGELRGPARALTNVSCVATNAHGQSQAVLPFVPADPPELLPQGNCTVRGSRLGGVITCHCAAEGNPPPRLEWLLPNRTLPGDFEGPELRATSGARGPAVSGELRGPARALTNVSCVATNAHGQSQAVLPFVPADPPELLPWGNCTVQGSRLGGAVTCHCVAEGNPPPRLEWLLPNRTLPGDFEGPELRATSEVRGLAVSGELRGPAWSLANVSCAATNAHGQSQAVLPFVPAGDDNLLLMVSSGVIGGLLLLSVLAIVVYKVARARKDEEEGPSIYDNEGNGEQRPSLKGGKPSKAKNDEEFNLYSKELGIDDYEAMERVEDYENLAAEGAGHYGNVGTWQPHLLSEQIYSNV